MDTLQMKYFLCLAKHLNYTSSASELEISTSTLSRQISALENELNVQLFSRNNKTVTLTQSGKYLQTELTKIYDTYQIVAQNTQRIFQGFSGKITGGILGDITLNGTIQDNFHNFIHRHPDCTIDLQRGTYHQLVDNLLNGTYDFIISFFFALDNLISLNYKIVEDVQEGILISSKNPLAKEKFFDPVRFKNQTFIIISSDDNEYIANGAVEYCQRYGFYPNLLFAPSIDAATLWVEAGMGVSFSYSKSIGSYNPALTFIPAKQGEIMTSAPKIVLAWDRNNNNPAAMQFIDEFQGKH